MDSLLHILFFLSFIAEIARGEDTDCYYKPTSSYSGTQNKTRSGRTCQRWDVQTPNPHNNDDIYFFPMEETLFDVHNYCRDPYNEGYFWCHTTDPDWQWEDCIVPLCTAGTTLDIFLPDTDTECHYAPATSYSGTWNKTRYGRTCQRWDVQTPHPHNYDINNFPMDETLYDAHNYCRDPDDGGVLWCLTTDPDVEFGVCNIPLCMTGTTINSFLPDLTFTTQSDISNMTTKWQYHNSTLYQTSPSSADQNTTDELTLPTVTQGANKIFTPFSIILVQWLYSLCLYI